MNLNDCPDFLTTQQLGELLGIKKHTIEVRRSEGSFPIPHLNPFGNRTVRYAKKDVEIYLENCRARLPEDVIQDVRPRFVGS